MTAITATENGHTHTITTTLFDLINAMQARATTPEQDAQIVPTVAHWIRSGRITFADDLARRPAA